MMHACGNTFFLNLFFWVFQYKNLRPRQLLTMFVLVPFFAAVTTERKRHRESWRLTREKEVMEYIWHEAIIPLWLSSWDFFFSVLVYGRG